jgi:hypothetical protein
VNVSVYSGIDKKMFLKELENYDDDIRKELESLYFCYLGKEDSDCSNLKGRIKKILSKIFASRFSNDVLIPLKFHDTFTAKVLFSLLHSDMEKSFTIKEVTDITGYSRQHIHNEIKKGKLLNEHIDSRYYIRESDLKNYMDSKKKK